MLVEDHLTPSPQSVPTDPIAPHASIMDHTNGLVDIDDPSSLLAATEMPPAPMPAVSAPRASPKASPAPQYRQGRWTPDEKILFLYGLKRFGKGRWKKMSIYLPHRSLVQIKSHAQKVLKRLEAGENVFRRLDENCSIIDELIVQAAKQRDAANQALASVNMQSQHIKITSGESSTPAQEGAAQAPAGGQKKSGPADSIAAAAALCQLSTKVGV